MTDLEQTRTLTQKVRGNATRVHGASKERTQLIRKALETMQGIAYTAAELAHNQGSSKQDLQDAQGTVLAAEKPVAALQHALRQGAEQIALITEQSRDLMRGIDAVKGAAEQIGCFAMTTRMLALNASIEAKRAGDAGAGFEVIAQEVQKLSQQVQNSVSAMASAVDNIETANTHVSSEALTLTSVFSDVASDADDCADQLSCLGSDIIDMAANASDQGRQLSRMVDDLRGVIDALLHVQQSTKDAVEGSAQNMRLCETIEHDLKKNSAMPSVARR
ncbi:MAG: methyl-accepting chemotaxis protein [Pseudomonadota bacterium]